MLVAWGVDIVSKDGKHLAFFNAKGVIELRHWLERRDSCDENEALRTALLKACSMLDDAVQLRDDSAEWFPRINEFRKLTNKS